ncbi:TPA: PTS transporter subunit EIIB, partial [Bacillus anthracis]|nr:PTS transporter subunit EIIB [Bacillus anthracis]
MDYNKLGKDILTQVGGKENVSSVSHCITRVRFILKDEAKANDDVIKNMSGVLDVVKQ